MANVSMFAVAALAEICGCYFFWMWLKLDKSVLWAVAGTAALVTFAVLLTRIEAQFAGRAFAAYGGVYIGASLIWMALIERAMPDRWDVAGGMICLAGAAIIIGVPR